MVAPEVLEYINTMSSTLTTVLVCATWLGVTIPLALALFYFSTSELRKKPIFIANAASISMGILLGLLNTIILAESIKHPGQPLNRPGFLFYSYFMVMIPLFIESILFFRLVAVYPPSMISRRMASLIYIPSITLKIARLVNELVFIVHFTLATRSVSTSPEISKLTAKTIEPKIEWVIQVVDNTFVSTLFLYRLHQVQSFSQRLGGSGGRRYRHRIASLFWIATSNFVFPVLFTLAQLVLMFTSEDFNSTVLNILISNAYVQIIGVLFATLWAATSNGDYDTTAPTMRTMEFAAGGTGSMAGGGTNTFRTTDETASTAVTSGLSTRVGDSFVLHSLQGKSNTIVGPDIEQGEKAMQAS